MKIKILKQKNYFFLPLIKSVLILQLLQLI